MHVQQDDADESALQISSSLASGCLYVFGLGVPGEPPILKETKSIDWDMEVTFLAWNINCHAGRISLPFEKVQRLSDLVKKRSSSRELASSRQVLSLTTKLWNVTLVSYAGSVSSGSS